MKGMKMAKNVWQCPRCKLEGINTRFWKCPRCHTPRPDLLAKKGETETNRKEGGLRKIRLLRLFEEKPLLTPLEITEGMKREGYSAAWTKEDLNWLIDNKCLYWGEKKYLFLSKEGKKTLSEMKKLKR